MLEQILQRITDTAKAWLDALVDAEAAVSQSDKCFTARDLQGARAALDRAQELYSHANPEQAAASMHTVSANVWTCTVWREMLCTACELSVCVRARVQKDLTCP